MIGAPPRSTWTFHSAGQILFGPGAVGQLGQLAARRGPRRVLVVTDPPLVAAGQALQVRESLAAAGIAVEVFDGGEPEPSFAVAERAARHAAAFGPDSVLGLGGGSNLDLAKMVATLLAHGGRPADYVGEQRVPGPILPMIAVPTTAGTGSEVSGSAVLTDPQQKLKVGLLSNFMRPLLAVVDPRLTLSCPRKVTADSGIDALTHAIEAYTAVDNEEFPLPPGEETIYQGRHPLGDLMAQEAIRLVGRSLRRAVAQPDDLAARTDMALAALLAGLAFSNVGVALVHAMEYPLGAAAHISHGAGNGLLLPFVMRFNLPARQARIAQIGRLLGCEVDGRDEPAAAEQAIDAVAQLRAEIGIPRRLREVGVQVEQLPEFAAKAAGIRRILRVNPRVPSVDQIEAIYRQAW